MSKQKVNGALDSVSSMLMYYHQALVEDGCVDPKREMATVLPKMINLSEAQSNYVKSMITNNPIPTMMDNMQLILQSMKLDVEQGTDINIGTITVLQDSLKELKRMLGGNVNGII